MRAPKACLSLVFGISVLMLIFTGLMLESNIDSRTSKSLQVDGLSNGGLVFSKRNRKAFEEMHLKKNKLDTGTQSERGMEFLKKIVYNRVGKCGSRSMLTLISKLSSLNNFTFSKSYISNRTRVPLDSQIDIVRAITGLPFPSMYSRHVHYIDFAKFGVSPPVYINMIRDPIERFSSQYHFLRYGDNNKAESRAAHSWKEGEQEMDINDCVLTNHHWCSNEKLFYIVPYFCGQDIMCQRPNRDSLYRAKMHVMENYLVVGILEDFEGMLQVLEKLLPHYFDGATRLWKVVSADTLSHTSTVRKSQLNATTKAVLKIKMKEEYEFYNFVKLRFRVLKKQLGIVDSST